MRLIIGQITFSRTGKAFGPLSNYSNLLNNSLKSLEYKTDKYVDTSRSSNKFSSEDLKNCNYLESLYIQSATSTKFDCIDLPTTIRDLKIIDCYFSKIPNVSSLSNLEVLNLRQNSFTSLEDFVDSSSFISLKELNLSSNLLLDNFTYKVGENNVIVDTLDVINNLPNLERVWLNGNQDISDYSKLTNNGFKEFRDEAIYADDGKTIDHYYRHVDDNYARGSRNFEKGTVSRDIEK